MTTTLAERLREIADNLNNGVRGTDAAGGPKVLVVAPEIAATIREAAAHLNHTAAQGVTVKALGWHDHDVKHEYGRGVCEANTPFSDHYSIWDCAAYPSVKTGEWKRFYCRKLSASFDTMGEAKAAAQADYEQRILSALSPAPAAQVTDEMVEAACDAAYEVINRREGVVFTGLEKRPVPADIQEWMRAALEAALSPAPPAPVGDAIADWSDLPKDIYVIEAIRHGGIGFDVKCCSVPMVTVPEIRYTRADLVVSPSAGEAPAVPVADAREWLIRKNGYFYRPNRSGYTMEKVAAGRYTKAEAEREASIEPENFTVLHESEVPDAPQVVDLKADLEAMRRERTNTVEALNRERDALIAETAALKAALEPSAETKAAYMGEFSFDRPYINDAGNELTESINVPWTTIKEIMAAIRALATTKGGA